MDDHELGAGAVISAAMVLTAMWMCKDVIIATVTAPARGKEWMRLRWLRMRGLEDYAGRHRVA